MLLSVLVVEYITENCENKGINKKRQNINFGCYNTLHKYKTFLTKTLF